MGQETLLGAGTTLFAPVGQRRCCVARLILAGLRGKACCGAVCLSGRAGRRAGRTGAGERSRQGMDIHVLRWACRLMGENAPFPRFAARGEDRLATPPATAIFPRHPAGRTAGSARTRPRDQSLGYPFLGNRPSSSPSPRPPKRRRRQAPARGPAAVYPHAARCGTKRSTHAPCSWGMGASTSSRRHWPAALPP